MKPGRVLIIDDEPLILKTTALLLKKASIDTILTTCDGHEGIEIARRERPDLILLDIVMPGMDGWEVLRQLKTDPGCARIPVVVFTAMDYSLSDSVARESGAAGICRKPFQLHQLMKVIRKLSNEANDG